MSAAVPAEQPAYGDPVTRPFWEAARRGELRIQRCGACGAHQFYPRPICVACGGDVRWVAASGRGTVYSATTVHLKVSPELEPPYVVAIVELEEGPRLTTQLVGPPCAIGDPVRLGWREREGAPPVPVFTAAG